MDCDDLWRTVPTHSRSWTDLVSNVTHIGGLRLSEHLMDFVNPGKAPPEVMLSCLHELTHHWCFHSSVGLAVMGLMCRTAETTLAVDGRRVEKVLHDVYVYRAIVAALRPLSEGLALFAELDANSLKTEVTSVPLYSTVSLFSGRAEAIRTFADIGGGPRQLSENLEEVLKFSLPVARELYDARLSDAGIKRKTNVLAASTRTDSDGYVIGYLAVKYLWRVLRKQSHRLQQETDLVLAYLKAYFYEDRQLIAVLLRAMSKQNGSLPDSHSLATEILEHIRQRFCQLWDVTEGDIEQFETLVLTKVPTGSPQWAACLQVPEDDWVRGERAVDDIRRKFATGPRRKKAKGRQTFDEKLSRGIHSAFSQMAARRHIVHLGTQSVEVDVDDAGRFFVEVDGHQILTGTALAGVEPQSGQGAIELLFSTGSAFRHRAVVVYGPKGTVGTVIPADPTSDQHELDLIHNQLRPMASFLHLGDATGRLVDSFLEEEGVLGLVQSLEHELPSVVESLYLNFAFNNVTDDQFERLKALLDEGGIYAILAYDRDLLDGLIVAGVVAGLAPYEQVVCRELGKRGFADPDAILKQLSQCGDGVGVSLLDSDGLAMLVKV
jgi:hypothetical protein